MARLIEPFKQFFDNSGDPLVSGKVWFYESGSSSLFKTTYADSGETIPNSNPVILAGDGRCPNVFGTGSYRAIVTDSTDVQISAKDPIGGANGVEFGADWNATQIYDISDVVRYDGKYWVSDVSGNLGNTPEDGIYWTQVAFEATTNNVLFGNFRVNQREVSGTVVLTAGAYGHDRFRGGAAGCTYTFATADGVTTITITAGTIEQEVEGANIQSDGYILQWGGSSQGRINGGSYGASGTVLASLVGGTNAIVEFGTGTLSTPSLRVGTSEQTYIQRPIGEELALCQRYYCILVGVIFHVGYIPSANSVYRDWKFFPVTMRAVPATTGTLLTQLGLYTTNPSYGGGTVEGVVYLFTGLVAGTVPAFANYTITADAEL